MKEKELRILEIYYLLITKANFLFIDLKRDKKNVFKKIINQKWGYCRRNNLVRSGSCKRISGNSSYRSNPDFTTSKKELGIHIEWSVNEKVAFEIGAGAACAGKRALFTIKMSGVGE